MLKLFPKTPDEIRARIRALLIAYIRTYRERRQLWSRYRAEYNQTTEQGDRNALYWYTCDAETDLADELEAIRGKKREVAQMLINQIINTSATFAIAITAATE